MAGEENIGSDPVAILNHARFWVLFSLLGLSACQQLPLADQATAHGQPLLVTGTAALDQQPGPSDSERMLQAMNASRLDAYRLLAERLYGVQLTPQSLQHWQSRSSGTIVGAQMVEQRQEGRFIVTTLKLDRADFNLLAGLPAPQPRHRWWE